MTSALKILISRSHDDPYQLLVKQKQTTNEKQLQKVRHSIEYENAIHKIIKFLCENGADVRLKLNGKDAIQVAIRNKSREILNILLYYIKPSQKQVQQVLKEFPENITGRHTQKYQSMKQDVEGYKRFLSVQKLLSKRSFSNIDTSRQLSSYFTSRKRSKLDD
jgi:hypothetical protein